MMVNQIRAGARSQVVVGDYTKRTPSPSDAFSFSVGPNKSYSLVPIATLNICMSLPPAVKKDQDRIRLQD
jgi:hypothetical protein